MAMTARLCFEGLLTELSKVNAPSMLLQDFNYFFNKAVNQYINKRYNIYDINQLTTDDLRVLKATTVLEPKTLKETEAFTKVLNYGAGLSKMFGGTYYIDLPLDYLHMLNCVCIYRLKDRYKCYDSGNEVQFAAKRLTGDSWSVIMNDFYNRPLPERPYYYINNVNKSSELPTNPITSNTLLTRTTGGTDAASDYVVDGGTVSIEKVSKYQNAEGKEISLTEDQFLTKEQFLEQFPEGKILSTVSVSKTSSSGNSNLPRTIDLRGFQNKSVIEREAGVRYGNASGVRCEIRYGHDNTVFELVGVLIDYIKAPLTIRLTQEQVNLTRDTSLIMEFPDYVCLEIINELVNLVMENTADPRLNTHNAVTQSIANPAQQLTQPQMTRALQRAVSQG